MNESKQPSTTPSESGSSPGPYSADTMSRYSGQSTTPTSAAAAGGGGGGMGPEVGGRNPGQPAGASAGTAPPPPPPPSTALSPWQGYVYGMDPAGRGPLQPFPGQPYRSPYPAFPGQYSEPYDQYLGGPLPPDYPLNVRYPAGDKGGSGGGAENNGGMGYGALMDNRSALPPFSSIATHPASGRGSTPSGLKDDLGEFSEGLGARLSRGSASSGATPAPGEFGEGLTARLIERGMNPRDDPAFHSSPSLVQYRPWEAGSGGARSDPPSHASPTSPSSSYSFAEGFLKFQPGTPTPGDKAAGEGANSGSNGANSNEGSSPVANSANDKWYHGKGEALSPYAKDSGVADKGGKDGNGPKGGGDMLAAGPVEPNRPPPPSSVGYSSDSTTGGTEESKSHSFPPYDGRDMLLSFGSPHTAASYDYYPPPTTAATGPGPWGYDMAKESNYHHHHPGGRPYSQNGRENVYGNGNPPDRQYQLSPHHDKMSLQSTPPPPPPPPPSGTYQSNAHMPPMHAASTTTAAAPTKGKRGRGGGRGAHHRHHHHHHHHQVSSSMSNEYGPGKQLDDSSAPADKPKKKKRKRCGECYGCQRKDNCGECAPCRNEKSHQICKQRRCEKLIERKNTTHAPAGPQPQAPPHPPSPHLQPQQPQPPPPPTVADKLQYLGGAGTAWW